MQVDLIDVIKCWVYLLTKPEIEIPQLWEDVWSSWETATLIDSPFIKPGAVMKMFVVDGQEVRRLEGGLNTQIPLGISRPPSSTIWLIGLDVFWESESKYELVLE